MEKEKKKAIIVKIYSILLIAIYLSVFLWLNEWYLPEKFSVTSDASKMSQDIEFQQFMLLSKKKLQLNWILIILNFAILFINWVFRKDALKQGFFLTLIILAAAIVGYFLIM